MNPAERARSSIPETKQERNAGANVATRLFIQIGVQQVFASVFCVTRQWGLVLYRFSNEPVRLRGVFAHLSRRQAEFEGTNGAIRATETRPLSFRICSEVGVRASKEMLWHARDPRSRGPAEVKFSSLVQEFWQGFGKPREGPSRGRGSYRQPARNFAPGGSLSA